MAQPASYPHHCQDSSIAQPVVARIIHAEEAATPGGPALPPAAPFQPSAPTLSFPQAMAVPQPAPPPPPAPLTARQVPAPAPTMQQLKVLVPTGINAGQQLQFTTPCGQTMFVTVQQDFAPGSYVMVQYQAANSRLPGVRPMPASAPAPFPAQPPQPEEADRQAMNTGWMIYTLGWASCCVVPFIAPVVWVALACSYFCCMSQHQRAARPRQRQPALAAGLTCMAIGLVCGLVALVGCLLALEAAAEDGQWHPHHHGNHSDDPFWTTTDWPTDFPPRAQLRGMVATARPLAMQEKMGLLHLGNAGEDKTTTTPIAAAAAGEDVLEEEVGNSKAPCRFANAAEKFKEMMHAGHHSIMLKWGHQEHDHEHRDREEESHHWHPFGHHSHDHEHDHEHHFKFLNMLGHHHDHEHDHEEKFENPKAAFKFKKLWGAKEADELYE